VFQSMTGEISHVNIVEAFFLCNAVMLRERTNGCGENPSFYSLDGILENGARSEALDFHISTLRVSVLRRLSSAR